MDNIKIGPTEKWREDFERITSDSEQLLEGGFSEILC